MSAPTKIVDAKGPSENDWSFGSVQIDDDNPPGWGARIQHKSGFTFLLENRIAEGDEVKYRLKCKFAAMTEPQAVTAVFVRIGGEQYAGDASLEPWGSDWLPNNSELNLFVEGVRALVRQMSNGHADVERFMLYEAADI